MPSPLPPHSPTFSFGNCPKAHENTTIYPAVQTKNLKSFLILPLPSRSASTKNSISQAQFFHFSLILLLTNLQAQTSYITSRVQLILGLTIITIQFILRLAQSNVLKMNVRPSPSPTSTDHMIGHDLQGLHRPLPTCYFLSHCIKITLAYYSVPKYARRVLIVGTCSICSLLLISSGHRSLHGSFLLSKSQFNYFFSD